MTKDDFRNLFVRALNAAADNAEARVGRPVPRSFEIELHAPGSSVCLLNIDQAVDRVYLGPDRYYRIIDVAVRRLLPDRSVVFVRVSGHQPTPFEETWSPADLGPFKQVLAETIEQSPINAADF